MDLEQKIKQEVNLMKNQPKILLFDIETAPNKAYVWGKYDQNVIAYDREWYMLTYAYKWYGDKKVQGAMLPDFKLYKKEPENDKELVKQLHKLFCEADIIVAHNGDQFDIRKTNARFLVHGLTPPDPYKTIDTKKIAKKHFNFNSNSLDDLGQTLGLGRKLQHNGFELWQGCMAGDKKSWKEMLKYNKQDVELLEKVYATMKSWSTNHPNIALYQGKDFACVNCGSSHLQSRGYNYTRVGKNRRFQCLDCGAWSQSRTSEKNKPEVK